MRVILALVVSLASGLVALLTGIGLASCAYMGYIDVSSSQQASYYMGIACNNFSGRVLDAKTSNAIEGIRVTLLSEDSTNSIETDSEGQYDLRDFGGGCNQFILIANDVDMETNGRYESFEAELSNESYEQVITNIDIYLEPKTNEQS